MKDATMHINSKPLGFPTVNPGETHGFLVAP